MNYVAKKHKRILALLVMIGMVTSSVKPIIGHASTSTQAFDTKKGVLNVDYAKYLSKNDLVFKSPITDPKQGIMVGSGKVGAQVWNENGLKMQFTGADSSEIQFASEGFVNLHTNPGMETGYSNIEQRLSLYDGLLTINYDKDRTVTVMGSPNSEVMGIHVEDKRNNVSEIALDLGIWDVSKFSGGDVPNLGTWKTVAAFADENVAGISRGQADPNHFGYTLAATVEGVKYTTSKTDTKNVRLNITPTKSYTIWIACASRYTAPNYDSITQAKKLLTDYKNAGYAKTLKNSKNWWHDFWKKSFVQYSGVSEDADYMESMYYLSQYVIASGAYGYFPFQFISGVYSGIEDKDSNKWTYGYWYWNQRDVYNSFFTSNHPDIMKNFNDLYSRNSDKLKAFTKERYKIDGIWLPETMGWNGSANGTVWSDFTKNIYSTGTEAAENMYRQYKYTNDENYLRDTAYPFMKEVCKFYSGILSHDDTTGKYYIKSANAHETYWLVQNPITDLAAIRSLFPKTIQTAKKLGVDSSLVTDWQTILDNLAPYPSDGKQYLPHDLPASPLHNSENICCELLWPYDVSGIDAPDYQMLLNNFKTRPCPYREVWSPDSIYAARLGLGDEVFSGLKRMLGKYQTLPNSRTNDTNGEFEYHGVVLNSITEALLQSYNDKIRVFPALPSDNSFVSKFTLLASGGFLVSSEKEDNDIKYVGIKSLYGNKATVINPWGTEKIQVRKASDKKIVATSSEKEITFTTKANTVYIVERASKPLSSFTKTKLTGTPNQGMKSLRGTKSTLGTNGGM